MWAMCADVKLLLMDWAAGTLDDAARCRVDAHIAACADCARAAADWRSAGDAAAAYGSFASAPLPAWRAPGERAAAVAAPLGPVPLVRSARAWLAVAAAVALAIGATVRRTGTVPPPTTLGSAAPASASAEDRAGPTLALRAPTPVRRLAGSASVAERPVITRVDGRPARPVAASTPGRPSSAPAPLSTLPSDAAALPSAAATQPPSSPPQPPDRGAPADPHVVAATPNSVPTAPSSPPPDPTTAAPEPTTATLVAVVTGGVAGPDGFARAEVRVIARPVADGVGAVETTSGADGSYALTLSPGTWSIAAEGAAYVTAWNGAAASPIDGAPLRVAAGDAVGLDFRLAAAPPGRISGRVVDAAGVPVAGALVVAAAPDVDRGGYRAFVAATLADGEGRYRLAVDEGGWLVAAAADWRAAAPALAWWGGDGDIVAVDQVAVARQRPADGIDFQLRGERGD